MGQNGLGFALLAAVGYTLATFFLKLGLGRGATAGQVTLWSNIAMGLLVQPLWFFEDPALPNAHWVMPLLACLAFLGGQVLTFAALAHGDVSVVTPLLGTKVIGVTLLNVWVFALPMPTRWWIASVASSLGIAIIAGLVPRGQWRRIFMTASLALGAALCFSLTDVLVQHWAGASDPLAFLPMMFGGVGLLSAVWCGCFQREAFLPVQKARPILGLGALLLAGQAVLMFLSLSWTRDATVTNILYGTRALLTVLAAWIFGGAFGLSEAKLPWPLLLLRLVGAALLFAAIFLILAP